MTAPTIAVLMTSYNRCTQTLRALEALHGQAGRGTSFELHVHLVDASSPDGTAAAVRSRFPEVHLISAPEDTYWGQGMAKAASAAPPEAAYHLWLNDDVALHPEAVLHLLWTAVDGLQNEREPVVVGHLTDSSGRTSYAGFRRNGRPLSFVHVRESDGPQNCDTVNGNVVLIPRVVYERHGGVDPVFPHAMGDIDFGLRVRAAGDRIVQAPGTVGTCENNATSGQPHSALARLKAVASVKQLPPRAWWTMCRRHAGPAAPAYFAKPYLSALMGRP